MESGLGVLTRALRQVPIGRVTESTGVATLRRFMMGPALLGAVSSLF